jgi:hypothetical protein
MHKRAVQSEQYKVTQGRAVQTDCRLRSADAARDMQAAWLSRPVCKQYKAVQGSAGRYSQSSTGGIQAAQR